MEIRYLEKVKHYGNMFAGEKTIYETKLQYKKDGVWYDVETVQE